MKYLIASDIHGSYYYGKIIIEKFRQHNADKIILLGDILYHGPRNDLPKGHDPKNLAILLNDFKDRIIAVQGNCDAEIDQTVLEFPLLTQYFIIEINKRNIFFTHGHTFNSNNLPPLNKEDILVHGHTHVQRNIKYDNHTYLNPGSISLPKEDSVHGYMILENNIFKWYDINDNLIDSLTI
ncbi:MAG: phosphodiesterase [Erysipelotrichaceae bacterium]|jgi:putative phosphoesterase